MCRLCLSSGSVSQFRVATTQFRVATRAEFSVQGRFDHPRPASVSAAAVVPAPVSLHRPAPPGRHASQHHFADARASPTRCTGQQSPGQQNTTSKTRPTRGPAMPRRSAGQQHPADMPASYGTTRRATLCSAGHCSRTAFLCLCPRYQMPLHKPTVRAHPGCAETEG